MLSRTVVAAGVCAIAAALVVSCGSSSSTSTQTPGVTNTMKVSGYVIDTTTSSPVTGYAMTVETPESISSATVNATTGRYDFSMPTGSDYIIRVTKTGYRDFVSTQQRQLDSTNQQDINAQMRRIYFAPMTPTSVTSPAINARIIDAASGARIASGFFRLVATNMAAGFQNNLFGPGSTTLNGARYWLPDALTTAGSFSNGVFTIPANTILPGFTYDVITWGASGYRDKQTTLTFGTTSLNTISEIDIQMTKMAAPITTTAWLLGQTHVGLDQGGLLKPVPLGTDRAITFTFDRDVTVNMDALKGKGSNQLLTVDPTTDNNGNGTTTSTTLVVETPAATAFSANVVVTTSGNTITITLAPDATLINGTIDTGDDLSYTMSATLTNGIILRDAQSPFDTWAALSSFTNFSNKILIRGNYP